jgi:ethanolamine ammonia-lyase small subunit
MTDAVYLNEKKTRPSSTPARIGLSHVGCRPKTVDWLRFRYDHALARDAVHSELSEHFLKQICQAGKLPVVQSTATDRSEYILMPPKGKQVDERTLEMLCQTCPHHRDVQFIISDGLSARAVEENAADLLSIVEDGLRLERITTGTHIIARFARVAIGDQIAHALGAKLVVNLIGERPGLSSACSMSAYLTYNPGPHTISSDRTVVSNIHAGGTPAVEAGAYITKLIKSIMRAKLSGVRFQQLSQ